jgi:glycosyltransferase involved in cell wall biosynthesis
VPYSYLGYINDAYRLSEIYSASNVTVSSSLYETFGQTLIEAMACGSIPVSFDGSGQADIVSHKKNGYLATRLSAESLAEGIAWGFKSGLSAQEQRRCVLRRYGESVVANQYENLYNEIIK